MVSEAIEDPAYLSSGFMLDAGTFNEGLEVALSLGLGTGFSQNLLSPARTGLSKNTGNIRIRCGLTADWDRPKISESRFDVS